MEKFARNYITDFSEMDEAHRVHSWIIQKSGMFAHSSFGIFSIIEGLSLPFITPGIYDKQS
jgi:hypothetical protein